jgi:Protein of unknown function (DUF3016)
MKLTPAALILSGTLATGITPALAGGAIEVAFTDHARYADAGLTPHERSVNLAGLAEHLKRLAARHLPDGQTLAIEVLDVDLAGAPRLLHKTATELRIVRGGADWPRIELRYTLSSDGRTLRSGSERLVDLNYQRRGSAVGTSEPLGYEKRLIDDWFHARFVEGRQPG